VVAKDKDVCKIQSGVRCYLFSIGESAPAVFAQQSVHLTLGILRKSQAVFYALSFFWLDGFAVPAPAQVTQTVGTTRPKSALEKSSKKVYLCCRHKQEITLCSQKFKNGAIVLPSEYQKPLRLTLNWKMILS
jgi:hypothetical protein